MTRDDGPDIKAPDEQDDLASVAARIEARADDLARRFDRSDWIELGAGILLALATVMAAWSAYQATRWSGEQAKASAEAVALRTEAAQAASQSGARAEIDVQLWLEWFRLARQGDQVGMDLVYELFRPEFKPAMDAWLALAPDGGLPAGSPFLLPEYAPEATAQAIELNAQADEATKRAREANQTGDNFVLTAVLMATVLFFAGIGTKFKGRSLRVAMLGIALLVFVGGCLFMLSLPQNISI